MLLTTLFLHLIQVKFRSTWNRTWWFTGYMEGEGEVKFHVASMDTGEDGDSINQNKAFMKKRLLQGLSMDMLSLQCCGRWAVNGCVEWSATLERKSSLEIDASVVIRTEVIVKSHGNQDNHYNHPSEVCRLRRGENQSQAWRRSILNEVLVEDTEYKELVRQQKHQRARILGEPSACGNTTNFTPSPLLLYPQATLYIWSPKRISSFPTQDGISSLTSFASTLTLSVWRLHRLYCRIKDSVPPVNPDFRFQMHTQVVSVASIGQHSYKLLFEFQNPLGWLTGLRETLLIFGILL